MLAIRETCIIMFRHKHVCCPYVICRY